MLTIRATAKLFKKTKDVLNESPPISTGTLGDWYCNILIIQRQHIILCVSEKTLLPILLPAKNMDTFPIRLQGAVADTLKEIGVSDSHIEKEILEMGSWAYSKTASRQILGSMNDFAHILSVTMARGFSLEDHAEFLRDTPCSPIGMNTPSRATIEIFIEKVNETVLQSRPTLRMVKPMK